MGGQRFQSIGKSLAFVIYALKTWKLLIFVKGSYLAKDKTMKNDDGEHFPVAQINNSLAEPSEPCLV